MQNERPVASVGDFGVRLSWKPLHFNKRISTHMLLCLKWIFSCRTMTLIQEFFSFCNIIHTHRRFLSSVHIKRSYIFRNSKGLLLLFTSSAKRPRSIYQYSNMTPRLSGQNCKFFKLLLSLNCQKRLRYKENNTKYRSLTWKPRRRVRIYIYRTWPNDNLKFPNLSLNEYVTIYFNGASTRPFAACSVYNKGCEEEFSLPSPSLL